MPHCTNSDCPDHSTLERKTNNSKINANVNPPIKRKNRKNNSDDFVFLSKTGRPTTPTPVGQPVDMASTSMERLTNIELVDVQLMYIAIYFAQTELRHNLYMNMDHNEVIGKVRVGHAFQRMTVSNTVCSLHGTKCDGYPFKECQYEVESPSHTWPYYLVMIQNSRKLANIGRFRCLSLWLRRELQKGCRSELGRGERRQGLKERFEKEKVKEYSSTHQEKECRMERRDNSRFQNSLLSLHSPLPFFSGWVLEC
ncbi:hypothetical protein TNCV_1291381 [Trichonephila clavipes]|nr:hypothetical protein TNCV_1291381 [Trichonephila clavipes]